MKILGLHGCKNRTHDAAAALVDGNLILAIAEEERFTRQKRAFDTSAKTAAGYCLRFAQKDINDIDAIAVGYNYSESDKPVFSAKAIEQYLPSSDYKITKKIPLYYVSHHLAHAASVYFTSPFSEAAILIVDGQGEDEATSIFRANGNDIKLLKKIKVDRSIGYLYSAISIFCGLGAFGAGKLMGLAAYGESKYRNIVDKIFNKINLTNSKCGDKQEEFTEIVLSKLKCEGFTEAKATMVFNKFGGKLEKSPQILQVHKDLAASVQFFLEDQLVCFAKEAEQLVKSDNLCISGGVALNCVANSVIENKKVFKNIFIQPACEDSGSALGAALWVAKTKIRGELSPYLGPDYSDEEIQEILKSNKIKARLYRNIERIAAKLISRGEIVGWFQGRMEYGPRALGNRSILADPRRESFKTKLNIAKGREIWRPFAPSILVEYGDKILDDFVPSPYMLKSFKVKTDWKKRLSAVVHIDNSTRPQTVSKEMNTKFYNLITEFYKLTGTPAVLNTSYNFAGEPIVCTPNDAIKTFFSSGIDYLVLGNYLVEKDQR